MLGAAETIHTAFHEPETRTYRIVQGVVWSLIFLSIAMLIAEPLLPSDPRLLQAFETADRVLLALFALEYVLRVASHHPRALEVFAIGPFVMLRTHILSRIRYALRPLLMVDLLAVLALFPGLRGLRALRLLRLLRTVKLFRYSNPFAVIFQAFQQHSLLFTFGFTVLFFETFVGGISIYLIEANTNPEIDTVLDGIWWALVTITTVGFGDITPASTLGRITGGALMISGMFTLAMFAGFVGSSLVNAMLAIREEQFRMGDNVNHVVVCGYDETTQLLLDLLRFEIDTEKTRVVIFEDFERPRGVPTDFLWVEGDPTKQSELDKVRLTHANAVIVVGSRSLSPRAADARTILITFTIRAYLEEHAERIRGRRAPLYLLAEVLDSENVNHARTAGADEVIETRRVGFSMLAHAVRFHGTADTMSRVLMSGSYNAYVGRIPDPPEEPITYGELLVRMQLTKKGGLVIGLRRPGEAENFNPPKSQIVMPDTCLVYLAERPILVSPD